MDIGAFEVVEYDSCHNLTITLYANRSEWRA
jgi:hypothetical protein